MQRRALLARVGAATTAMTAVGVTTATTALTGCLDRGGGDEDSNSESDTEPEADWFRIAESAPALAGRGLGHDEHGLVVRVDSPAAADLVFEDPTRPFVAETSFDDATLFHVATWGPNGCHALRVRELSRENGTLTGRAESVDTSDADEACAAVELAVSRLVRVTGNGVPLDRAELSLTDGRGNAETVESFSAETYAERNKEDEEGEEDEK